MSSVPPNPLGNIVERNAFWSSVYTYKTIIAASLITLGILLLIVLLFVWVMGRKAVPGT